MHLTPEQTGSTFQVALSLAEQGRWIRRRPSSNALFIMLPELVDEAATTEGEPVETTQRISARIGASGDSMSMVAIETSSVVFRDRFDPKKLSRRELESLGGITLVANALPSITTKAVSRFSWGNTGMREAGRTTTLYDNRPASDEDTISLELETLASAGLATVSNGEPEFSGADFGQLCEDMVAHADKAMRLPNRHVA